MQRHRSLRAGVSLAVAVSLLAIPCAEAQAHRVTRLQAPPGAAGEELSLVPSDSTATAVPPYPITTSAPADTSGIPRCKLHAYKPNNPAGSGEVQAQSTTTCTNTSDVIEVTSSLYWSSSNNPYNWQFQNQSPQETGYNSVSALTTWTCNRGQRHWWHTLNATTVIDRSTGVTYTEGVNSSNTSFTCS